ncbi:DNA-binding transcriptional regulator, GntR family [Yoonia tamlensis]|uniref:DNA-binding transcriptional regulator, GntR family n=1 Tax=Yoonia tamlensis TaxID=390270 RepID=A0A1I6FYI9_9RHOB|nr:GntR family transcriptional regulator [Yoonia tamlensis]SFR34976.1 DNA-binding transcriptional regulator, GntR family [Yoonia tamlensis]
MKQIKHAPRLSDVAYESILQALFDARVPMGERISQGDLVALTGIPVGPVRDALKVLEADGLLVVHPRSGIEVIQPTTELIRSTIQFRTIIEKPAARRFASTATKSELLELRRLHEDFLAVLKTLTPTENVFSKLGVVEDKFHVTLVASLGNELVDASYRRIQLMGRIIRGGAVCYPQSAKISIGEHLDVIAAWEARDPDLAEDMLARHLTNAMGRNLGV